MNNNPFGFHLELVPVGKIKRNKKNPRNIKKNRARGLKNQMRKFGYLDRIILNKDYTILAGHQRYDILLSDGVSEIECLIPKKKLSQEDADELLVGHNLNTGFWDEILLNQNFDDDFLNKMEFGDMIKPKRDLGKNDDPIYPLAPRFSEKHNYVMIITDNEIDEANLRSILGISKMKDYKSSGVSEGYVITYEQFKKAISGIGVEVDS